MPKAQDTFEIVIPVYNEIGIIAESINKIVTEVKKLSSYKTTIILVDDGSSDGTWDVVKNIRKSFLKNKSLSISIETLRLSRNFGKDAAIFAGLKHSKAELVMVMDADCQHPPDLIKDFLLLQKQNGFDVVNGVKNKSQNTSLIYKSLSWVFNKFLALVLKTDFSGASDFKLLNRRAVNALCECGDQNFFFRGLAIWIGFSQGYIKFDVQNRIDSQTKWTKIALFKYAVDTIVLFSHIPVYLILLLGIFSILLAAAIVLKLAFSFTTGTIPTGYATVVMLLILNLGFSMLSIGSVGLYVKNTLDQTKNRPRYFIIEQNEEKV